MPAFSQLGQERLATCHPALVRVFQTVILSVDCAIVCGHRSAADQAAAFAAGKSKAQPGQSPHNRQPSLAVDAVPYPVDWQDSRRFALFAGFVLGTAAAMGVPLTWGGDWNRNWQVSDNGFDDLPHFELTGWRTMP